MSGPERTGRDGTGWDGTGHLCQMMRGFMFADDDDDDVHFFLSHWSFSSHLPSSIVFTYVRVRVFIIVN